MGFIRQTSLIFNTYSVNSSLIKNKFIYNLKKKYWIYLLYMLNKLILCSQLYNFPGLLINSVLNVNVIC